MPTGSRYPFSSKGIIRNAFAEITALDDNVKTLVQPLKGREHPIVVPFLQVRARLLPQGKAIEFLCLKNYLYSEKPEVEPDTLLASDRTLNRLSWRMK